MTSLAIRISPNLHDLNYINYGSRSTQTIRQNIEETIILMGTTVFGGVIKSHAWLICMY